VSESRFWGKVQRGEECWMWTGHRDRQGYGRIHDGSHDGAMLLAHRVSWELANGPIPDGMCVLHSCDNPGCVRPSHLHLGTVADNQSEMATRHRGIQSRSGLPYGARRSRTKSARWNASIRVKGRTVHLGSFGSPEEASAAAQRERERLYSPAVRSARERDECLASLNHQTEIIDTLRARARGGP
jgi:hypothetical protein